MLTKSDLKLVGNLFADKFAEKLEEVKQQFTNEVHKFKDEIITKLDKVMVELKAIREEQTIITGYKDQIEDHDTRINKLEEVLQP